MRAGALLMRMAQSVHGGPGCMPIGRGRSGGGVRLRPGSGMRGEGGGVVLTGAEDGLRFVWRVSSGDMRWPRRPVPCPLRLAGH